MEIDELLKLSWEDLQFYGFVWENDGKDLKLFVDYGSKPITELRCPWTSDLKVNLHWERVPVSTHDEPLPRGGPLLSIGGEINRTEDDRWNVYFDFAECGTIEFECESITVA